MRAGLICCLLLLSAGAQAYWPVWDLSGIGRLTQLQKQYQEFKQQTSFARNQLDMLKRQVGYISGNFKLGSQDFHSYQHAWGQGMGSWESALNAYHSGQGTLGELAKQYNHTFPIQPEVFAKHSAQNTQQYYQLSAKTTTGAQAISTAAIDKIEAQMKAQEALLKKIDGTKNLKDSLELLSRIQVESNLIALQQVRLLAVMNQQQAISQQGGLNAMVSEAKFLELPEEGE